MKGVLPSLNFKHNNAILFCSLLLSLRTRILSDTTERKCILTNRTPLSRLPAIVVNFIPKKIIRVYICEVLNQNNKKNTVTATHAYPVLLFQSVGSTHQRKNTQIKSNINKNTYLATYG
jgi:hypothetical protein